MLQFLRCRVMEGGQDYLHPERLAKMFRSWYLGKSPNGQLT